MVMNCSLVRPKTPPARNSITQRPSINLENNEMSARRFQKPSQIKFKDGKLGTALLVTLAFDQPTSPALVNESYVPSTSHTDPQSVSTAGASAGVAESFDPLNSLEMLRSGEAPKTRQAKWHWISLRMNCLLQIIQASYVEKKSIPLMAKTLGELYTTNELTCCNDLDLRKKSMHAYPDGETALINTVDQLMQALDEGDRLKWFTYEQKHEISMLLPGPHGMLHKYFHAAQWLFAEASPELLTKHRSQFGDLSRLLVSWAGMYLEVTTKTSLPSAWYLFADVAENVDLTVDVPGALEDVDAYLQRRHYDNFFKLRRRRL
eukprot:Blabericola_migrator_1__3205@NODE_1943_length_3530_cov_39_481663_g1241_i0_p1_GENE_NODE_1943_length_3530_cov_39_481663_g1241_i0NODE_1943_length_3530_cov_39_481663_g1241_i0_p1_ORF_typecomplete_len319_score31_74_NODE_1943_length_3530_cov_39_481663_g1241_i011592115